MSRKPTRAKSKPRSAKNEASILLWTHLRELQVALNGEIALYKEHSFYPTRRWKFDFAVTYSVTSIRYYGLLIGIEIEGGAWIPGGGGHNRGQGFIDDMEKYNHATLTDWKLLRFTPQQVLDGSAIEFIRKVLAST